MINIGGKEFNEIIDTGVIDYDKYPYSRAGRNILSIAVSLFKFILIGLGLIALVLSLLRTGLVTLFAKYVETVKLVKPTNKYLGDCLIFVKYTAIVLIIVLGCLMIVWCLITVRRWAFHERRCLINDWYSRRYKKRFLSRLNARGRLKEITSKTGDKGLSVQDEARVEALKTLIAMDVEFHTRENIDTGEIEQVAIVKINVPDDDDAVDELDKVCKKLGALMTRSTSAKFSFGDVVVSDDWDVFTFTAARLDPKQARKLKVIQDKAAKITSKPKYEYETSFDVDLFDDNSAKIEAKRVVAVKWANTNAVVLDRILTTSGQRATRKAVKATAASVTFDYELPFSLDLNSLDKLTETLNRLFKTDSATTEIHDGGLRIVLPLPEHARVGIDTKLLYTQAFGRAAPVNK